MKKYVEVMSNINITLTGGLQYMDSTNPDAHIADRLNVKPLWSDLTCDIKAGAHVYPGEIVNWNTFKALKNQKVLTVMREFDSESEIETEDKTDVDSTKSKLEKAKAKIEESKKLKKKEDNSLEQIAGD
jgi:hypothetical protein